MAATSGSIVKSLDVIKHIGASQIRGFVDTLSDALFFFKALKNDSATALSQQLPRRFILGSSWFASQNRFQSPLSNWAHSTGRRNIQLLNRF
jgi:hypothetical protein